MLIVFRLARCAPGVLEIKKPSEGMVGGSWVIGESVTHTNLPDSCYLPSLRGVCDVAISW